jgi:predicted DNA-binding protein
MRKRPIKDRVITLRLPEDVYQKLDYVAEQHWCTISSVVRNGIRKELAEHEDLFEDEYIERNQHHMKAY